MEEEKHIIKKAVVELYLPSSGNSFEIQNKSLSYFKQYIVPMIEKIVGRLSTGDRIVRIDKLEFDFKNFKYDEPNEAALMKLEQKMEEEIIRLVRAETNDDPRKTAVKKISKSKRDEELFLHLLLNGTLPWWTDAGTPVVLKELAEKILEQPGTQFLQELRMALSSPAVRKRISIQLPFASVEKIIRATCEQPEALISIVEALAAFLPSGITAPYPVRPVLYRHALRHSQSRDVKIARYVATLIREEMDFAFVEKLYTAALKKSDKSVEDDFFERELENKETTDISEEIAFIIRKTLSLNNRYFNGRIRKLFSVKDRSLFFISAEGKDPDEPATARDKLAEKGKTGESLSKKESPADKLPGKEKPGKKKAGIDDPENEQEEHSERGEENDKHPATEKKEERLSKLREEKKRREALKAESKNKTGGKQGTDDEPESDDSYSKAEESGKIKENSRSESRGKDENPFEQGRKDNPLELYAADPVEDLLVGNAGIIIITPFLPTFFKALELYDGKAFISPEAVERAVCLLHYLSTGKAEDMQEHDMLLNKIICGMDISEPVALQFELTEREKDECHGLLEAVAGNWPALKGTSGEGMRDAFFTREGILEKHANGWNLKIERITIDILLDRLTWGISIIKLPWSREMIFTNW
ncbi:MAG: hypothetical protein JWO09_2783 [Bacteroidetes bacterium]|nr:hypothetical protein [Bacteroidota bacterium]